MHSFRTDSRLIRDALERLTEASSIPPGGTGREAGEAGAGIDLVPDRREAEPPRVIGRLVALNGTQGVISCPLDTSEEDWSVGHLISIVHKTARLVALSLYKRQAFARNAAYGGPNGGPVRWRRMAPDLSDRCAHLMRSIASRTRRHEPRARARRG
jgi:hypothetical protein